MTSSVIIPPSSSFDFAETFDLAKSNIVITLIPSSKLQVVPIKSVTAQIQHSYKEILKETIIPVSPVPEMSYIVVAMPNVNGVPIWGVYTTILTLTTMDGKVYKVQKKFNLCPPDTDDPFAVDLKSELKVGVDCANGTLIVSDFVCKLYKGRLPSSQTYNLVHQFPKESKLKPVKDISSIPYIGPAYNGLNKISGYNLSKFDFPDNISVVFRVTANAEKDVRCVPDFESITCGMQKMIADIAECQGTDQDYLRAFNEAELLLWSITVGYQRGEDISDDIIRIEEILNIHCECQGCPGEKVGQGIGCQKITGLSASNTGGDLLVGFNSAGVPDDSAVRIAIRQYCHQEQRMEWEVMWPDQITIGGLQTVTYKVKANAFYEVIATTIVEGQECGTTLTNTGNADDCPQIVAISSAVKA